MKIKVGVGETCKFCHAEWFDPSPSGVALGSGEMLDAGCEKEDELDKINIEGIDISKIGTDEQHQCPLWQPAFKWCERHKRWYLFECEECLDEMEKDLKELYGGDKC